MQWLAFFISIFGAYLNIKKNKWGFVIWNIGNLIWIYLNIISGLPAGALIFIVYSCFNIYGFYEWLKGEKIND